MKNTTFNYEIMFVNYVVADEVYEKFISKYKEIIEKAGGILNKYETWGVKKLAYEIENQHEGIYTLLDLTANSIIIREIDRKMKIDENILRHLILRKGN